MKRSTIGTRKMNRWMHPVRNQRGAVLLWVAISMVMLLSFCMIAIDGSILMTTKTQLQNAADAGALAAASGLALALPNADKETNAKLRARQIVLANFAVEDSLQPVRITDDDVTVFDDYTKVRVKTYRTVDHGDPLHTYFMRIFDQAAPNLTDIWAQATAEVFKVCDTQCVKPWAIPDRFQDLDNSGDWSTGDFYDPLITGYLPPGDVGTELTIHFGQPPGVVPGQYYSIDLPPLGGEQAPLTGGSYYREWIAHCAPWTVGPGDSVQLEPGRMSGPTAQGIQDLIDLDPNAHWDPVTKTVVGSDFGKSPRIALVPFYDPAYPPVSGRNYVKVTKVGAFFMDAVDNQGRITGYFMKVAVPGEPCDDPNSLPTFTIGLHLIKDE